MALEEQLSSDLQSVREALLGLGRQIEQANAREEKPPVPPSRDKQKIEQTGGPDMSDSKTVSQYKKLFEQVLGPSLSKTLEIESGSSSGLDSMMADYIESSNSHIEVDERTNQILTDMLNVVSTTLTNLSEITAGNNTTVDLNNIADILNSKLDNAVTSDTSLNQPVVDAINILTNVLKSEALPTDPTANQTVVDSINILNSRLEAGLTSLDDEQSLSDINDNLSRLENLNVNDVSRVLGENVKQSIDPINRIASQLQTSQQEALLKEISEKLPQDETVAVDRIKQELVNIADLSAEQIAQLESLNTLSQLDDHIESLKTTLDSKDLTPLKQLVSIDMRLQELLKTSQEQSQIISQNTTGVIDEQIGQLVELTDAQLAATTDATELAKTEAQVVEETQGFNIVDIDRSAMGKLKDVLSVEVTPGTTNNEGEEEDEGGLFDFIGEGITSFLGEAMGQLLGKAGSLMKNLLGKTFSVAGALLKPFVGAVGKIATGAAKGIKFGLGKVFDVSKGLLKKSWGFSKNLAMKSYKGISSGLGKVFGIKDGLLGKFFGFSKNLLTNTASKGKGMLGKVFGVKDGILGKFFGFSKNLLTKTAGKMQGALGKAFSFVPKLGGIGKSLASIASKAGTGILGAVQGAIPAGGKLLGMVGKVAKFAGPIGGIIAGGMAVFDGVGAAMDEYKKSGSILAAAREGVSGAMSTLTFGLVDQETFSGMFTAIGDGISAAGDFVSNQVGNAWEGVKNIASGNIAEGLGNVGEMLTFGLVDNETIKNALGSVSETFSKAGQWLSDGAGKVWDSITGFFTNSPDVWDVFDESGRNLSSGTQKVAESTGKVVEQTAAYSSQAEAQTESVGSTVMDMLNRFTPLGAISDVITGSVDNISDAAGQLQDGVPPLETAGDLLKNQAETLLGGLGSLFSAPLDLVSSAGGAIVDAAGGLFDSVTSWFTDVETPDTPDLQPDDSKDKQIQEMMQSQAQATTKSESEVKELTNRLDKLVEIQGQQLNTTIAGNKQNLQTSQQLEQSIQKNKKGNTIIQNSSNVQTNVQAGNNAMDSFRQLVAS